MPAMRAVTIPENVPKNRMVNNPDINTSVIMLCAVKLRIPHLCKMIMNANAHRNDKVKIPVPIRLSPVIYM